jgi:hypothetical protein
MEAELHLYSTLPYTPGWYYTKFPGFWNTECYRILSDFSNNPDKYKVEEEQPVQDEDMQLCQGEEQSGNKNSKRKHSMCEVNCDCEL